VGPTPTPTTTPSISVSPSVTPSVTPSITTSISVTPSITPTITPTISVTPSQSPPPPSPSAVRLEFLIGNMDPYDNPSEACLFGITDENVFLAAGDDSPTVGDVLFEDPFGNIPYDGNGHSYYYLKRGISSWACKIAGGGEIIEITAC